MPFVMNVKPPTSNQRFNWAVQYAARNGGWLERASPAGTYKFTWYGDPSSSVAPSSLVFFIHLDRPRIVPGHETFAAAPSWVWLNEIVTESNRVDLVAVLARLLKGLKERNTCP